MHLSFPCTNAIFIQHYSILHYEQNKVPNTHIYTHTHKHNRFKCLVDGIQVTDSDYNIGSTSNGFNVRTKNGPLKDELIRQIIRHRFIEQERDSLWKFKAPTLQKSVVAIMKLLVDINNNKLDQLLKRVNVVEEFFELRRAHPDKIKEYNNLWLNWMKRNYRRRVDGGVHDQGNRMTSATEQSNLLQTSDFINKVDRNNARNETNRRNNDDDDDENLASNPWTRQAASERKKRKAQRMANANALKRDGGAATSKSIDVEYNNNNNRSSKVANMKKELKQMNQLANTFSVGSAPYRNEIDSGAFDASVSYRIDLPQVH